MFDGEHVAKLVTAQASEACVIRLGSSNLPVLTLICRITWIYSRIKKSP